jgi:CP family cyanate transporter-like MFS transporter
VSVNASIRPARSVPAPAWWIGVAIVLIAANLRPAVVGVAPLLSQIQSDEQLSATAAGILTALPVLCFGLIAPLAPPVPRRSSPAPCSSAPRSRSATCCSPA